MKTVKRLLITVLVLMTMVTMLTSCNDMLDKDHRKTEVTDAVFPGKVADVEAEL